MLNEKLLNYFDAVNIKIEEISGVAVKYDVNTGWSIHINLRRKGNNTHKIPLGDDEGKKDRIAKQILAYLKKARIKHLQGLEGLEDL